MTGWLPPSGIQGDSRFLSPMIFLLTSPQNFRLDGCPRLETKSLVPLPKCPSSSIPCPSPLLNFNWTLSAQTWPFGIFHYGPGNLKRCWAQIHLLIPWSPLLHLCSCPDLTCSSTSRSETHQDVSQSWQSSKPKSQPSSHQISLTNIPLVFTLPSSHTESLKVTLIFPMLCSPALVPSSAWFAPFPHGQP